MRVRRLRSHGISPAAPGDSPGGVTGYDVAEVGFNYRFDDIRAAIIRPRFARLGTDIERRRE
jgi:dTDP-4-amino-4,6-dideoxygalactose transaminase